MDRKSINTKQFQAVLNAEHHLFMIKYCLWSGEDVHSYRQYLERLRETLKELDIMEIGK